jgi:hypothetical protein
MLFDPKWNEPKSNELWRQNLLLAAGIVRRRGLAKWEQEDRTGRVCVHGAISIAITGETHNDRLCCAETRALYRYLLSKGVSKRIISEGGCALWNNAEERTVDDVIEALEGAAAMATVNAEG